MQGPLNTCHIYLESLVVHIRSFTPKFFASKTAHKCPGTPQWPVPDQPFLAYTSAVSFDCWHAIKRPKPMEASVTGDHDNPPQFRCLLLLILGWGFDALLLPPKESDVSSFWNEKDAVFDNTFLIGRCQENIVFLIPGERYAAPFWLSCSKHHRKDDARRKHLTLILEWVLDDWPDWSAMVENLGCSTAHHTQGNCMPPKACLYEGSTYVAISRTRRPLRQLTPTISNYGKYCCFIRILHC